MSRGLARDVQAFYAGLADADSSRRGELDGRCNLSQGDKEGRNEAVPALRFVFLAGSVPRGEFRQNAKLASRSADWAIAALLRCALLESNSAKGPVRFGLPLEALAYYFLRLYPKAAA